MDSPCFCLTLIRESEPRLGRRLLMKWAANRLLIWSKEKIVLGFNAEYQFLAAPFKVDGKARHSTASEAP